MPDIDGRPGFNKKFKGQFVPKYPFQKGYKGPGKGTNSVPSSIRAKDFRQKAIQRRLSRGGNKAV